MEFTGEPAPKRVKLDEVTTGGTDPTGDDVMGEPEGGDFRSEAETASFSREPDKVNFAGVTQRDCFGSEAEEADLGAEPEGNNFASKQGDLTGEPGGDLANECEPEGNLADGPRTDNFTGKQEEDFIGLPFGGNVSDEVIGQSFACETTVPEVRPPFEGGVDKGMPVASPLSSGPDDEPVPLAYDDEDLNEDAQCWLDSNYDKSKAAAKSRVGAVQLTSNNDSPAAGETVDGVCTRGDDETAGRSESRRQVYEKTVLVEKAKRFKNFNMLPDGWVAVTHDSGMPVYLHKELRVCTLSMPYFLGPGSVRKHDIPLAAVPCLEYRRAKAVPEASPSISSGDSATGRTDTDAGADQQASATEGGSTSRQAATSIGGCPTVQAAACPGTTLPQAKVHVETAGEMIKSTSLSAEELHSYCSSLFEFTKIQVEKFPTWKERREHTRKHRPQMSANAALIVCSAEDLPEELTTGVVKKGNLVLNPKGKTFVCILHEYLQWSQKTKPTYVYRETDNPTNPYSAVVKIDDMEYGTGHGANKKNAKSDAARKTLAVLLSAEDMQKVEAQANSWENMKPLQDTGDVVFFDNVKVDDKRMTDLCKRAGLPSPYAVLLECLKRNFMMGDTDIKMQTNVIATAKVEVTLTVSKYTAQVIAKNKKLGKQEASQKLLQQLHPNITCWGSILRLYGDGSIVSVNERKVTSGSTGNSGGGAKPVLEDGVGRLQAVKLQTPAVLLPPTADAPPPAASQCDPSLAAAAAVAAVAVAEASCTMCVADAVPLVDLPQHLSPRADTVAGIASLPAPLSLLSVQQFARQSDLEAQSCQAGGSWSLPALASTDVRQPRQHVSQHQPRSVACQTSWYGYTMLHKATQHPDMSYSPFTNKNIVRGAAAAGARGSGTESPAIAADVGGVPRCSIASQTDPLGHAVLHKAIQHPDVAYASDEGCASERGLPHCAAVSVQPSCWGAAAAPAMAFGSGHAGNGGMMGPGLQPPPHALQQFSGHALPRQQYGLHYAPYYVDPASYPLPVYHGYAQMFHGLPPPPPLPYDY